MFPTKLNFKFNKPKILARSRFKPFRCHSMDRKVSAIEQKINF